MHVKTIVLAFLFTLIVNALCFACHIFLPLFLSIGISVGSFMFVTYLLRSDKPNRKT